MVTIFYCRYFLLLSSTITDFSYCHYFFLLYDLCSHIYPLEQWFYVAQIFYKLTINLTKMSIVLLYLRIFVQRWFRISCYILLGVVSAYCLASTLVSIFQCHPISGAWDKGQKSVTCISLTQNWYSNAGYSIATDVLILALPMQPIWASKLPVNQKRALMFVFALGSL